MCPYLMIFSDLLAIVRRYIGNMSFARILFLEGAGEACDGCHLAI